MSVEHVSSLREFNDALNNSGNRLVVVDFHATWCGPCLAIAPFYESLASKYNRRARFLKVDVDVAQDVSAQCGVTAMPTFHMYRNGSLVSQFSGADQMRLAADIERYAPSSAEVSFSGAGQRLGADPNAPPKVNWDAPERKADTAKSRREAALAAAAKRAEASIAEADAKNTAVNAEVAAVSSASGSGEAGPSVPKEIESEATSVDPSGDAPAGNDSRLKVDAFLLKQMEEMGFPKIRSEKALILTGNKGLEQAMEWCFTHADDPDVDEPLTVVTEDGTVKSQLTPEECKRRADEALKRARARRAELDKQEEKEREKERLRSGKEINKARQLHEDQERKRAIEKRRQEKLEALAEKRRVRELLEADKQRRRERFNMGGSGQAGPSAAPSAPAPAEPKAPRAPSSASGAGKIQLRLPDGSRLEKEFQPEQSLEEVLSFIERERPELPVNSLRLSQQYPRRVFSRSDYQTTLQELELLPRGALNVSYH